MIEANDLERISGSEAEASAAFDKISPAIRRYLGRYLAERVLDPDERSEVLQTALAKLWASRLGYRYQSIREWWGYVRAIGDYCVKDHYRAKSPEVLLEWDLTEVPDADLPYLDALAEAAEDGQRLTDAADEVWLGSSGEREEQERRLLAVQLFYQHKLPWQEVALIVGVNDREELDEWLNDAGTLRAVAYRELYKGNDDLTAELLHVHPRELDRVARRARSDDGAPPQGWSWPEARVVIWHHRNGLYTDQILRFSLNRLTREEAEGTIERCRFVYPFRPAASRLRAEFGRTASEMGASGLWRRLAWQYCTYDELPQRQIHDRIEPAATAMGASLTAGTLNVWLSGGRLYSQLAAHLRGNR